MKKSLWCMVLVIFTVAVVASDYHKAQTGAGLFLTNAYAQVSAQKAVPAKKTNQKAVPAKKAKLKVIRGEVTIIEDMTLTVQIEKEGGSIDLTAEPKMLKGLEIVDKVMVTYETLPSGENRIVKIKKWERTL